MDLQVLLITVKQIIKIPRQPSGPSYFDIEAG